MSEYRKKYIFLKFNETLLPSNIIKMTYIFLFEVVQEAIIVIYWIVQSFLNAKAMAEKSPRCPFRPTGRPTHGFHAHGRRWINFTIIVGGEGIG